MICWFIELLIGSDSGFWRQSAGWISKLETQDIWCFSLSPKAGQSWCPILKVGRVFLLLGIEAGLTLFLLSSGFQLIEWGTVIFFSQLTDLNVNFIPKHPHRYTQITKYLGPYGLVKLTCYINQHSMNNRHQTSHQHYAFVGSAFLCDIFYGDLLMFKYFSKIFFSYVYAFLLLNTWWLLVLSQSLPFLSFSEWRTYT